RRPPQTARRRTPALPARARPRPDGSRIAVSLNLRRRRVGCALVVDPADLEVVALLGALEAELDIGVLGDRRSPVGDKDVVAVMFEGQLLDEMRRNDLALGVLDEAGIHRMRDQRLDFGGLAPRGGAPANRRCHQNDSLIFNKAMIFGPTLRISLSPIIRRNRRRSL